MHYKKYKSILSPKNGMNIYRGCTHGCIYCDSRSACYQFTHDFEDIEVKQDAPAQLEAELLRKRRRCMIATGAMCDPYIPLEAELLYTRRCLEVIERLGFGLAIQTKSDLILRDIELLASINKNAKCVAQITLTTFDERLCSLIEPKVCATKRRFEVLKILRGYGIPTVVWLCPILPYINDTEDNLRGILGYCAEAGVKGVLYFGAGVTLREGDREYFYAALREGGPLDRLFPGVKRRYIDRFGLSYECKSERDAALSALFYSECERYGMMCSNDEIFRYMHGFPENAEEQISLFS